MTSLLSHSCCFFLADVEAREAGRMMGHFLAMAAFLGGAIKCWSISRRPKTNTHCALALMLVLLGFIISGCIALLRESAEPRMGTIITGVLGLIFVGLMV